MKKILVTTMFILLGMALFAVPVTIMIYSALEMEKLRGRWMHGPAVVVAVLVNVLILVVTTYVSTHLVVRLFKPNGQTAPAAK